MTVLLFGIWFVVVAFSALPTATDAASLTRAYYHPSDPNSLQEQLLTEEVLDFLHHGRPYKKQETVDGYSGSGVVIQDVHAPPETIWKIILDFEQYPERIPKFLACQTYDVKKSSSAKQPSTYSTEMTIGFQMLSFNFFVKHSYHGKDGVLLWTLDDSQESELLEESIGYWLVRSHPSNVGWSRVTYQIDVKLSTWIPSFVSQFMAKQALDEATRWVKKYSEHEYKEIRKRRQHQHKQHHQKQKEQNSRRPSKEKGKLPIVVSKDDKSPSKDNDELSMTMTSMTTSTTNNGLCSSLIDGGICHASSELSPSTESIGILRYVLVSSVIGLIIFNTYLYFSHYR